MLSDPHRLVTSAEHRLVARRGRKGRSGPVVVSVVVPAVVTMEMSPARSSVVVPKRVGNAVQRNRVQRRLRHLLRARLSAFPSGSLSVVRAEAGATGLTSAELGVHLDRSLAQVAHAGGRQ